MIIEDSLENFRIPAEIIQNVLDSKLEIGDKQGPPLVPRKFKPVGKQYLKSKQPDRSKHWILDSLEEGSIAVTAAAPLYGVSISALRRWICVEKNEPVQEEVHPKLRRAQKKQKLNERILSKSKSKYGVRSDQSLINLFLVNWLKKLLKLLKSME